MEPGDGREAGPSQAVLLACGGLGGENKDSARHLLFSGCALVLQRLEWRGGGDRVGVVYLLFTCNYDSAPLMGSSLGNRH